ncbi:MAG: MaoC/PaaZ C-terminal domain-containing protein [Spirochaetota bacterium]
MSKASLIKIEKGQSFSVNEEVDKYRAIYYAGASGDFNPIHIDPEFGKMVGLGGTILHGLCSLGFVAKTVTDWAGDPGKLKKLKCRFASPVYIGDNLSIQAEVSDVKGNRGCIDIKVTRDDNTEVLKNVYAEVEI